MTDRKDPRFPVSELVRFIADLYVASGVEASAAQRAAESIVNASLRGVDSHGVQLVPFYLEQLADGRMDARATGRVVSENGAILIYDGENGVGQTISDICTSHAVRLASRYGLGLAVARESNHFGAAAWWARKISRSGMIGIVLCNASSIVAPWQGREPRWGTNPICVSMPGGENRWLLDMATTTVAMGKIYKANLAGEPEIAPGWALDSMGVPTTSTAEAMRGLLAPLGGYKGSGLAMMVEILCGVLGGGGISTDLGGFRVKGRPFRVSQFFLAIDPGRAMPLETFTERLARLEELVKSTLPAAGYEEVLLAGEPERRAEAERLRDGVPVAAGVWQTLLEYAGRLGVRRLE